MYGQQITNIDYIAFSVDRIKLEVQHRLNNPVRLLILLMNKLSGKITQTCLLIASALVTAPAVANTYETPNRLK